MNRYNRQQERTSSMWGGLILLVIGVFLLLKRLDLAIPHWVFSWETILIAIGLIIGAKRNFTGAAWIILVAVGVVFLMDDILPWNIHISRFIWPLAFVVAGIFLIVNSTERKRQLFIPEGDNTEDYININSLFGGAKKIVLSKNFRGGVLSTTFGGAEVNLSQADFYGTAVLDVQCLFGGVEIVVPPHWEVRMDVNAIFGGIDDKRVQPLAVNPDKVLLIKGSCTFGGVDIKSY